MNTEEVLAKLKQLNLTGYVHQTGDPRWKRIFIEKQDPDMVAVRIGRISMFNNELYNLNWYAATDHGPLNDCDFIAYKWDYLLQTGKVLTPEAYKAVVDQALTLAIARQQEILAERQAKLLRKDGKRYNRRALAPPNPRRYLWDLLIAGSNTSVQTQNPQV